MGTARRAPGKISSFLAVKILVEILNITNIALKLKLIWRLLLHALSFSDYTVMLEIIQAVGISRRSKARENEISYEEMVEY